MATLVLLLVGTTGTLGLACRWLFVEWGRRGQQLSRMREVVEWHRRDDERMIDALWERAEVEIGRVTDSGWRRERK